MSKGLKIFVIILIVLMLGAGGLYAYKIYKDKYDVIEENVVAGENVEDNSTLKVPIKTVQTFKGTDRPIAVMIDNHKAALPQGGLNDAYMVYEIIVEGGESRLMALFKGKDLDKIGPVRSSRHYFLDYALENDAIYVHFGWSPQAEYDISNLKVNNINGISESSSSFWRTKDKSAPHNVATSTQKILEIAKRKDYATTSTKKTDVNYLVDDVNLENGDWTTKEKVTTKNIIITFARNATINDGENKGRQTLYNTGTLDGYYITNGRAIKITCEKSSRSSQTVYKDLEGNEIKVNDGNTFVQICPIDAKVRIEGLEDTIENNK